MAAPKLGNYCLRGKRVLPLLAFSSSQSFHRTGWPLRSSSYSYTSGQRDATEGERRSRSPWLHGLLVVAGGVLAAAGISFLQSNSRKPLLTAQCKEVKNNKKAGEERPELPNYNKTEISSHKTGENGVWVTYKDGVYDITEFLPQHPGGKDKLMLAAGGAVDPYWQVFAQHNTEEVEDMIEEYRIGNISPADRQTYVQSNKQGPYANDPVRSPIFKVNTNEPFNAETPPVLLPQHFTTPNNLFFVRNHLPVPVVNEDSYRLQVSVPGMNEVSYSLQDLKAKFPQHTVTATIQCAGNRREELAKVKEVRGISWTGGAIGNATWTGVKVRDVLAQAGLKQVEDEEGVVKHIHFEGLDKNQLTGVCYGASIPVEKALSVTGDCLLVHTMNGEPLPRDHGYPVRALVPGTVGARNVKWLYRIVASDEEYSGQWQQRDYKGFSPSVDWSNVDFSSAPAIQELPVTSLICSPPPDMAINMDEHTTLLVEGVAWSGGGRDIVRVDVSADGGNTWLVASLKEGVGQRRGRAWAWTTWEAEVPISAAAVEAGRLELCCKAVDSSYNVQPDTTAPIWNLRGCLSNAWHRIEIKVQK